MTRPLVPCSSYQRVDVISSMQIIYIATSVAVAEGHRLIDVLRA